MPFVHVELIEGRTEEQLTNMVKRPLCTRRRMEKISFQRISVESLAFSENKWLNKCIND